jgi:flagellar motor switch protein FliN/FliY
MSTVTSDQRFLLDPLVELLRGIYQGVDVRHVHASMLHPFDDPLVAKRNYPMRVIDVALGGELEDHIVFAGCFRPDVIADIMQTSVSAIVEFTGVSAESVLSLTNHELDGAEQAVDMLDGMWGCPTVTYDHPAGDLMVIFGTGFARACEAVVEVNAGQYPGQQSAEDASSEELPAAEDVVEPVGASDSLPDVQPEVPSQTPVTPFTGFADLSEPSAPLPTHQPAGTFSSAMPNVEVILSAELGSTRMPLGAAAGLGANTVLTLDQRMDEPVQVLVNGIPYATARMVVVDGEYGLEILEVLELQPALSTLAA